MQYNENMTNLPSVVSEELVSACVEEIEAIMVEQVFIAQSARLELFWETGATLRRYESNGANISDLVKACARDNRLSGKQMGERNLWTAINVYDNFPTKEFPDGKAASLAKVKRALGGGVDPAECLHEQTETICRCKECKKVI